ncbi:hypothetical protein HPB47_018318 [Ixodes persulcatus]|uniref:Uncharacterized protein n=1 Tax=Ixodes persulcatus TaxID=34615 RepID=A0AC60QL20_IXOPE|nr:hypothetical protein HPB47_018318 [Ixodes persulcatus]
MEVVVEGEVIAPEDPNTDWIPPKIPSPKPSNPTERPASRSSPRPGSKPRPPQLPSPRGGLNLSSMSRGKLQDLIFNAAQTNYDAARADQIRINATENSILISTPSEERARTHFNHHTIRIKEENYPLATYVADPANTSRGIITNKCPRCGMDNPPTDHDCEVKCAVCRGPHPTGSPRCKKRFQEHPAIHRRQAQRLVQGTPISTLQARIQIPVPYSLQTPATIPIQVQTAPGPSRRAAPTTSGPQTGELGQCGLRPPGGVIPETTSSRLYGKSIVSKRSSELAQLTGQMDQLTNLSSQAGSSNPPPPPQSIPYLQQCITEYGFTSLPPATPQFGVLFSRALREAGPQDVAIVEDFNASHTA